MSARQLELASRRGALQSQIAGQRAALAQHVEPLEAILVVGDQGVAGLSWLKRHPLAVGAAATLLALLKPRRAWRWAQRGLLLWRSWKSARSVLSGGR